MEKTDLAVIVDLLEGYGNSPDWEVKCAEFNEHWSLKVVTTKEIKNPIGDLVKKLAGYGDATAWEITAITAGEKGIYYLEIKKGEEE